MPIVEILNQSESFDPGQTGFRAWLSHANTADRTYTLPDVTGGTFVLSNTPPTFNGGKTTLAPSLAGYASMNIAPGATPSAPAAGDIWAQGTGLFFYNGSSTVNLTTGGSGMSNPMTTLGDTVYGGASGAATRLAGTTNTRQQMLVQTGTGAASAAPQWVPTPAIVVTGMDATGATDSTPALNAAIAALPTSGGTIIIPDPGNGIYSFNLVIIRNGITIIGPGMLSTDSGLVGKYCQAYNPSQPVIQFGNDNNSYQADGCVLKDFFLYGNGTAAYGLVFTGGAYKNTVQNIQIVNFTNTHLLFKNEDVNPCEYNKVYNLQINSSIAGSIGVAAIDKHVSGSGWTSANDIIGFNIQTGNGGYQLMADSNVLSMTDGYIQDGSSGQSILIKNTYSGVGSGQCGFMFQNVQQDENSSGNYNVGAVVIIPGAGPQEFNQAAPISGTFASGCSTFVAASVTSTTGSITAGLKALTVGITTGIYPGSAVMVMGAGPSGNCLISYVASIAGSILTLTDAADTTVNMATTYHGDITGWESKGEYDSNSANVLNFSPINKTGMYFYNAPILYQTTANPINSSVNAGTTAGPWNGDNVIWDLGNYGLSIIENISDSGVWTISSITQSGYTVTVTLTSDAEGCTGDIVHIMGVNQPGINGTWQISAGISGTVFQFTSNVSQTLAGITGTPVCNIYKVISSGYPNAGSLQFPCGYNAGIFMQNPFGGMSQVLTQDPYDPQLNLLTPDQTNGYFGIWTGTGITTGMAFSLGNNNGYITKMTGLGVWKYSPAPMPAVDSSFGQIYFSSVDSKWHIMDTAGNDAAIGTGSGSGSPFNYDGGGANQAPGIINFDMGGA